MRRKVIAVLVAISVLRGDQITASTVAAVREIECGGVTATAIVTA
jgi:hypothetical protein